MSLPGYFFVPSDCVLFPLLATEHKSQVSHPQRQQPTSSHLPTRANINDFPFLSYRGEQRQYAPNV